MKRRLVLSIVFVLVSGCRGRQADAPSPGSTPTPTTQGELPHATMVARAMEELKIKTASFDRLFQLGEADWQMDQEAGTIVFTSPKGLVATAPASSAATRARIAARPGKR